MKVHFLTPHKGFVPSVARNDFRLRKASRIPVIEGGRVFFDAAAQCLYEECGAAGSVREAFCLGQRVLRQEAFRADAATGKVFFVRHPLLTCAPQKSAGERTQGTHALEVRSSEIGFGRAESPEAFAPADSTLGKRRTSGRFLLVFPFMEEKRRNAPSPMADEGFLFRQFNPLNRCLLYTSPSPRD